MGLTGTTVTVIFTTACAGSANTRNNGGISLDKALNEAAVRIDDRIPAKSKIALLNFSSPTNRFSEYVLNELEANLLDIGNLLVIDRKELDLIRNEMRFQVSGEVSDSSMQALGEKLGAQYIISGSLTDIGGTHRMVVMALVVESAAVAAQYRTDVANDSRVQSLLSGGKSSSSNFSR